MHFSFENIYRIRWLNFGLIFCLFCAVAVGFVFALEPSPAKSDSGQKLKLIDRRPSVIEYLEVLGDNGLRNKLTKADGNVRVRAIIRGKDIAGKSITADLSQLTGNPDDRKAEPLAKDIIVFDDHIEVNWFVTTNTDIHGGDMLNVTAFVNDESGVLDKKLARIAVFIPVGSLEKLSTTTGDIKVEARLKPTTIHDHNALPIRITAEPADEEAIIADQRLPRRMFIPEGTKAYKIAVEDISGTVVEKAQIKDTFMLSLGYPAHINPELARNLRLFVLSDNRWLPLPSRSSVSRQMVITESARQFGIYRLLAPAELNLEDVFVYPNPVQFGEFEDGTKSLKFRNIPLGSVIEIYTVSGEKIREIEAKKTEVTWDGRKGNGDLVTSGLYIYRVRIVGKEKFGKIAVIR